MTKQEADSLWVKANQDIYCFADLVTEQETDKLSKWWRRLVADIVADVHKQYEKKPFRTRTIRKDNPINKYND
jgi:hypothetical protein